MTDNKLLEHKVDTIYTEVKKISKILTGNGNIDNALTTRFAILEDSVHACQRNSLSNRKGKITVAAAAVSAIGAVACALIALLK